MSTKETWEDVGEGGAKHPRFRSAASSSVGRLGGPPASPAVPSGLALVQRESEQHYQEQQRFLNPLFAKKIKLDAEDLGALWDAIEQHLELSRRTVALARQSLAADEGAPGLAEQAFLVEELLLRGEEMHDALLSKLDEIKRSM